MAKRRTMECKKLGCINLTDNKNGYCDEHQKDYYQKMNERDKRYRARVGYKRRARTEIDKFYSSKQWQDLRAYVLARDNYLCQDCLKQGMITDARHVHHIDTVLKAWDKRFDEDNLISLCKEHHDMRHGKVSNTY